MHVCFRVEFVFLYFIYIFSEPAVAALFKLAVYFLCSELICFPHRLFASLDILRFKEGKSMQSYRPVLNPKAA